MAFRLPPANQRYSQDNENNARRLTERAINDLEARVLALESAPSGLVGPTAAFTHDVTSLSVAFTDTSTAGDAAIASWSWAFGDGDTSTQQNPTHAYDAPGDYTVTLTVTDANALTDQTSDVVTAVAPAGDTALLVGMFRLGTQQSEIGSGPAVGGTGVGPGLPRWSVCQYVPTPGRIAADIVIAEATDILLILNLANGKNLFAPGGVYDATIWQARVRQYLSTANGGQLSAADALAFKNAVQSGRIRIYLVDEPAHPSFGGSLSPTEVNQMGLFVKGLWPGATTIVRAPSTVMKGTWDNGAGVAPPPGGWTGVDYGWAQWDPVQTTRTQTIAQWYTQEIAELATVNLGCIASLNWINAGLRANEESVTACWDALANGSSNGLIKGTSEGGAGGPTPATTFIPCGSLDPDDKWVMANPEWIKHWFDVVSTFSAIPCALLWQHVQSQNQEFMPWENRSDLVAAFDYGINTANARTSFTGWRTPK